MIAFRCYLHKAMHCDLLGSEGCPSCREWQKYATSHRILPARSPTMHYPHGPMQAADGSKPVLTQMASMISQRRRAAELLQSESHMAMRSWPDKNLPLSPRNCKASWHVRNCTSKPVLLVMKTHSASSG